MSQISRSYRIITDAINKENGYTYKFLLFANICLRIFVLHKQNTREEAKDGKQDEENEKQQVFSVIQCLGTIHRT